MIKQSAFLAAALATVLSASAVPARPGFRTITQPDGTEITAALVGDETCHFYRTADGTPLLMDSDGYLRLATVDAKGRPAQGDRYLTSTIRTEAENEAALNALSRRASEKRESYAQSGLGLFGTYPSTGEVRCLVFLVEYTDVKFTVSDPNSFFTDMLNQEGFNQYGATGSARDYFLDQSSGAFRPTFDVYGPIQLSKKQSYYGGNDYNGQDLHAEDMVLEAVEACRDIIDYSDYDFDNDGEVDNIYVIYAGRGEASYGSANTVWPHSYFIFNGPTINGKKIYSYTCSNEWEDTRPDGIGTFCHEFSHTMGLPDLYTTDYNETAATKTPGAWSVLDVGPYNNDGRTPPNYSAFERNALGWLDGFVVNSPASVTLEPIHESNRAMVIGTDEPNEFFLFENRQREGWDAYIPGHGMLVWHIDFDESIWNENCVNNTSSHQYVDIVEANGRTNNENYSIMAGYPFPGTSGKTAFTFTGSPSFRTWDRKDLGLPITGIREENGIISFDVAGGNSSGLTAAGGADSGVTVKGNTVEYNGYGTVIISDLAGRTVASLTAEGHASVSLPSGFYIVATPEGAVKVAIS